ncbi:MAG TPA: class I SAM-dependent methyltransferase [Gemmatimonadaceae bacterium]|nr:class I SAM-dependent methyltransferase [Gemmatimonadaceae bacterium]
MQSEYAQSYRELYERHWWWRARERRIVETLEQYRPSTGWARILDIGCGDGLFFDRLLEFGQSVDGVEPDGGIVDPDGPHGHRITVSPFDASFQPGKLYSLVLMLDVLEHLQEPVVALRHAADLLEPGGLIVATVPAFMSLWTNHDVLNQHVTRYTKQRLQLLAGSAGLQIESISYFFHWTCAGKLVVRAFEAVLHPRPGLPRVPNGWLNRFLYAACVAEQELLGRFHIPFGSSILFVAR